MHGVKQGSCHSQHSVSWSMHGVVHGFVSAAALLSVSRCTVSSRVRVIRSTLSVGRCTVSCMGSCQPQHSCQLVDARCQAGFVSFAALCQLVDARCHAWVRVSRSTLVSWSMHGVMHGFVSAAALL